MALLRIEPYIVDSVSNFVFNNATVTSNLVSGNANLGNLASANFFSGNGSQLTSLNASNIAGQVGNALVSGTVYTAAQPNITSVGTLSSLSVTGNITSGNVAGGNLVSANYISGNGSLLVAITGANVTGAVSYATTANSVAVANVTGIGNIATINKDGNASNILYGNGVFASAPVTYGNSNVAVYLPTYTGNISPGNISIGVANLSITGGNANYVLKTDGAGNLSWVAQSGGGSNTYTSVTVDNFTGDGTTTAFTLSVTPGNKNQTFVNYNGAAQLRSAYTLSGTTITFSEAPANGSSIEVTTTMSVAAGNGDLTVRTYTGDNTTVNYTVTSGVAATNILVTQNGLLQTPTTDYTVSAGTLTFVTAPGTGEKIQIRELTTAIASMTIPGSNTQVLFNNAGSLGNSAQFTFDTASNTLSVGSISVTGNIIPTANVTYNLGNSTNRFKDLFLAGSTIDLAGAQIKTDATTGAIALVPTPTVSTPNPTALVISPSGAVSTAATTGGTISSGNLANAVANSTVIASYGTISLSQPGNITPPFTGVARCYPTANVNIVNIFASLGTASSTSFQFTLKKNGSNVANGTITGNSYRMTPVSANISVTTTDYLTLDITSGTGATDLKVDLQYKLQ